MELVAFLGNLLPQADACLSAIARIEDMSLTELVSERDVLSISYADVFAFMCEQKKACDAIEAREAQLIVEQEHFLKQANIDSTR